MFKLDSIHQLFLQERILHKWVYCLLSLLLGFDHSCLVIFERWDCGFHLLLLAFRSLFVALENSFAYRGWVLPFKACNRVNWFVFSYLLSIRVIIIYNFSIDEKPFYELISIKKFPFTILYVQLPISFIKSPIFPKHFSISVSHIIFVIPLIQMATPPRINSIPVFFVIFKLSFVFVTNTLSLFPYSMSASYSSIEMSFVVATVFPVVLSEPMKFSLKVLTFVKISILKKLSSFAAFDKVNKCSLVSTTLCLCKNTKTICLTFLPFSNI